MTSNPQSSRRLWSRLTIASLILGGCTGDPALDGESAGTGSDDGTATETGETGETPECDPAAFEHAPPSTTTVDGLPAVPIDIHDIDAVMIFTFDGKFATVDATITFQVGEDGGMPLFALRQGILVAELDGQTFDPALLARHDFGRGEDIGFRVVEQELEPCSIHTLRVGYELLHPEGGPADGFRWLTAPSRLLFDSKFQEYAGPSLYLDSWLPANLPFDRHSLSISLTIEEAPLPHMIVSNGAVEELGEHQWQVEFDPQTTSMSPYFGIAHSEPFTTASGVHTFNGQDVPYVIHHSGVDSIGCLLESCESQMLADFNNLAALYGPYRHPNLTVYLSDDLSGGHYAGLLTAEMTNNMFINLGHLWWGAGVYPATYTDAWIDEGWALYSRQTLNQQIPFDWDTQPPVALYDPHPFVRSRHQDSLNDGMRVFAGLAAIVGPQAVPATMAAIYEQIGPLEALTTAELERQFHCLNDQDPDIRRGFWRYVYGFDGEPEPAPADYCE